MDIKKIAIALAIVLVVVSAFIDFKDADNEITSDRPTEDDNVEREPGFEAVFAIIVLLVVACLFSRKRESKKKENEDKDDERG